MEIVFDLYTFLFIVIGTAIGLFFGAMPGLTSTAAVAMLIPMTYGLEPSYGIGLMLGTFCGGTAGGAISATLLNIPGTPSSICTTLDAYPMVKNGKAGLALGISAMASLIGGLFSAIMLMFLSPYIASIAMKFGPLEYLFLVLIGLILSVRIVKGSKIKATVSLCIGILLSLVGPDPITGVSRLTFGNINLRAGIGLLPLMVGFFAISQVLIEVNNRQQSKKIAKQKVNKISLLKPKDWFMKWKILLLSCFTGCFIGALPGTGGSIASISAYSLSQHVSKNAKNYGNGEPDGVIASESSNNAMTGGALIPLLALGIPGDACTAVMLGGLKLLGVQTGPSLFANNQGLINGIFLAFIIANIIMFVLQIVGMKFFIKILTIPKDLLVIAIVIFSTIGIYCVGHNFFDLFEMLFFGLLGFVLIKYGFGIIPCLMGFIMGGMAEKNMRTAIMMYDSPSVLFTRPIVCFLMIVVVALIISFFVRRRAHD